MSSSSEYSTTNNCNNSAIANNANGPQRENLERSRTTKSSVQFSQSVGLRCFFVPQSGDAIAADSSWLKKDDVDKIKSRARTLAKLHCHIRNKRYQESIIGTNTNDGNTNNNSPYGASATLAEVVRYQIVGESLRGMEYVTDPPNGRKRRGIAKEAIRAAVVEQRREQQRHQRLVDAANSGSTAGVDRVLDRAVPVGINDDDDDDDDDDNARQLLLAEAYGAKAREARAYARRVAEEDAVIASEILAEDLSSSSSQQQQQPIIASYDAAIASNGNGSNKTSTSSSSYRYLPKGGSSTTSISVVAESSRNESLSSESGCATSGGSAAGPDVAAGIAKSFRRADDGAPRRRSIVSMQA